MTQRTTAALTVPVTPPCNPRWNSTARVIAGTAAFFVALFGATFVIQGPAMLLPEAVLEMPWLQVSVGAFSGLGVSVLAVVLIRLLVTRVDRRTLADIGLVWDRRQAAMLGLGTITATAAIAATGGLVLVFGLGTPPGDPQLTAGEFIVGLGVGLISAFLVQGFPEELIFRGYVLSTVRASLPVAVVVSTVVFALLHIFSQSPAEGVGEQALYVVMAGALGFMCVGLRLGTGSLWAAVGGHGGFHIGWQITDLYSVPDTFAAMLVIETIVMVAIGIVFLGIGRRRGLVAPAATGEAQVAD